MRKTIFSVLAFAALVMILAMCSPVKQADAQFAGQTAFQVPFTVTGAAGAVYIPACTTALPTTAVPCIPNRNQLGHTVTLNRTGSSFCGLFLEGSNDNTNFVTMAASHSSTLQVGMFYANGYFTYLRLRFQGSPTCVGGGAFGVYTGYATPLPINPMSESSVPTNVGAVQAITAYSGLNTSPYLIESFQCFNPGGSTAYLQLFKSATSPTLGTSFVWQMGIAAGSTFTFSGPPILNVNFGTIGPGRLWAGASTASGGAAAVGTALTCQFQTNGTGPFYPYAPASP